METEELLEKINSLTISKKDILSIVLIGHVDTGKSTLGGQLIYKLGLIDERTLEKYRKQAKDKNRESWFFSWILDTDEIERDKGKTVDVGKVTFELENKKIVLLDAPGHSIFVPNMIKGAGQADLAVLIVSARTSEFESGFDKKGQTKEHIYLSRICGINHILVLVNKMDEVDWSEERFQYIKKSVKNFLSFFYSENEITFIPISGYKGENILERKICDFYNGPSFLEYLNDFKIERDLDSQFSFSVVDKTKQMGIILYDVKIETGKVVKGEVIILPKNISSEIIGIYNADEIEIEEAFAGDFIKIKLKENIEEIGIGDIMMEPSCKNFIVSNEFVCKISVLDVDKIISVGYESVLHLRLFETKCVIKEMASMVKDKIVKKNFCKKKESYLVKIETQLPIVFNNTKNLDRLALRNESQTIALGVVKKVIVKK